MLKARGANVSTIPTTMRVMSMPFEVPWRERPAPGIVLGANIDSPSASFETPSASLETPSASVDSPSASNKLCEIAF